MNNMITEVTELDQAIREIIFKVYDKCYIGKLKVKPLCGTVGYDLLLALDCEEKPIHIAAELEWNAFCKFIEEELRKRHLHTTSYYTGYKYEQRFN